MAALVARDAEAGVAVGPVQAHGAVAAGAGRALVAVQLAEASGKPGRADAGGLRGAVAADASVLAGARAAGADGRVAGGATGPGRTSAQKAPLPGGAHARGIAGAGAGDAGVWLLITAFAQTKGCVCARATVVF